MSKKKKTIIIDLPKIDHSKIRSGIRASKVIKSKRDKAKRWRKRKHRKVDNMD